MAFITLRQANVITSPGATVKGSPLTNAEVDNNFSNINIVIGFRENLITSANANLVAAVNEVRSDLDNLSSDKISNGTSNVNISTANGDIEITANLIPNVSNVINLGSSTRRFKDLYLTGNTINLGGDTISSVDGFIRINNANVFTTNGLIASSNVRLLNSDGTRFVELRANAALASNITFNFPSVDGTSGQALVTDAAGNLSFAAAGATLTNDTTTNNSFFPVITTSTSGALTTASVSSTKLSFNPSTGRVSATVFSGSGADLGSLNAGNVSTGTLAVARGGTALGTTPTNGQLLIGNGTNYTLNTLTGTTNRVTVTNGLGAITLTSPQDIATSSSVQFGSFGVGTAASGTTGEIRATNNITAFYSDRRLKMNITPIADALNKLCGISGVTFQSNDTAAKYGYTDQKVQVGVIAQEVQSVLPQIVVPAPFDIAKNEDGTEYSISGENYMTVQYDKLIPLLIESIKELKAEIDQLKKLKG